MIEIKDLTKKFKEITAIENLNFNVKDGEIFGYLGPNGAGKTTTVRILCGLIKPTSGKATIDGLDAVKDSEEIRKKIGFLPDNPGLYDSLTLEQNLKFYAKLYGLKNEDYEESLKKYLELMQLEERRKDKVGNFSKGMRQKVAIIRSMIHEPKYLFFDEPTSGLDPVSAKTVRDFILKMKTEKRVIFINTHNLDEAQKICTRVAVLNKKILQIGNPKELEKNMFAQGTSLELAEVNTRIRKALEKQGYSYTMDNNKINIQTKKPEKDNPRIAQTIVKAGGKIISLKPNSKTLEDVYFKLIQGEEQK